MSAGASGRRGDLVQQRLEQVVIIVVDDEHIGRRTPQRQGREQPAEPATYDNDAWTPPALQCHLPKWSR